MTVAELQNIARKARETLWRMEHEAATAQENGQTMPAEFWAYFGVAYASVGLAEAAVRNAMESE